MAEHHPNWSEEVEGRPSIAWRSLWRIVAVSLALYSVVMLGFLAYAWYIDNQDISLTAAQVYQEYDKDTKGANQKYKAKFVRVTGKLRIYQTEKSNQPQLYFDAPEAERSWYVVFALKPDHVQKLKNGQDITIRGRFNPRKKPDGNLMMSNCSIGSEL